MPQIDGKPFTQLQNLNCLDELRIQGVKVSTAGIGARSNFVLVKQKSDLPAPVGGVITLAEDFDYEINGIIDLTGDRIQLNGDNVIFGLNASEDRILTNNAGAMFTGSDSISRFERIAFQNTGGSIFSIGDSGGDQGVFTAFGCRFVNSASIGTFADVPSVDFFNNFIINTPNGISFTGSGIIAQITNNILSASAAGILIDLGTAIFDAVNINSNYLRASVVTTFINAQTDSANITTTGQGSIFNNVTIGSTPNVTGVSVGDLRWDIIANNTLPDTVNQGSLFMTGNAVATTIVTQSVAVKVAGTTTDTSITDRFSQTANNTLTYNGRKTQNLNIVYNVTAVRSSGSGNRLFKFTIYQNGSPLAAGTATYELDNRQRNISVLASALVQTGDTFELFVSNEENTNDITVTELTGIVGS